MDILLQALPDVSAAQALDASFLASVEFQVGNQSLGPALCLEPLGFNYLLREVAFLGLTTTTLLNSRMEHVPWCGTHTLASKQSCTPVLAVSLAHAVPDGQPDLLAYPRRPGSAWEPLRAAASGYPSGVPGQYLCQGRGEKFG